MTTTPSTHLDPRFSDPDATATSWVEAARLLAEAPISWCATVRTDGRPHVTPLMTVWQDGALHLTTGPGEQKAVNLAANPAVVLTTGCNRYTEGLDVVVEGVAERVQDQATLEALAAGWLAKYGEDWRFEARDGAFHAGGGEAWVFRVAPVTAFGFARGTAGQTRWRFG